MKKGLFCLVLFFSSLGFILPQETPESAEAAPYDSEQPAVNSEQDILEMDIRTSSLMELAAWCRTLGVSDGGSRNDLANRLRRHYGLPVQGANASAAEERVITIESARTTEYFTLDIVDEEYARLTGNVVLSLKEGNAVHRIKAWEIVYNRTRNVMTASGGVEYIRESEDSIETFKGETITVNLDNWSSIFIDGYTDRSSPDGGASYRFAGTVVSRNSEDTTVLTRAEITNGQNPDALWSLNASKLWLLPGSDWAVLNAVLKVGNIPVLWLPFFFYPSDEIVFHPVIGYRTREGTFVQTTTYILGRPRSSGFTENSITRIFGASNDGEKTREGLFLRNTGRRMRPADEVNLSVLFDAYANMGGYLGAELTVPGKGVAGELGVSFGLGLTRNIYVASYNVVSPFPDEDGKSEWNTSYFLSKEIPLRYRFEAASSFNWPFASLSWSFPLYSDPYVNRDFTGSRSKEMDWLGMIREGSAVTPDAAANTSLLTYSWNLNGSVFPQTSALYPYVTSLSVSSVAGSMNFQSRDPATKHPPPSYPVQLFPSYPNPDGVFYVPSRLSFSLNASASGTPLTLGGPSGTSFFSGRNQQHEQPPEENALNLLPAPPRKPWEDSPHGGAVSAAADPHGLEPPVLSQRFSIAHFGGPQLNFDYRFAPTGGIDQQYWNDPAWENAGEAGWDVSSRLARAGAAASMGLSLSQPGENAYSGSFRINGRGNWQNYVYVNPDYLSPGWIGASRRTAHRETIINTTYDFTASYRPFSRDPVWGNTSVSYSLSGLIGNYQFDPDSAVTDTVDEPRWNWAGGKWNGKDVTTHEAGVNLNANIMDRAQNLTLTATILPRDMLLSGTAVIRAWISTTELRASVFAPDDPGKRELRPFYVTETLRFGDAGHFELALRYEPEALKTTAPQDIEKESALTSFSASLALYGFNASYTSSYIIPYKLNTAEDAANYNPSLPEGWVLDGAERSLRPGGLKFSYHNDYSVNSLWKNRISLYFTANAELDFDLQRYTYSKLHFDLEVDAAITNFLTVKLAYSMVNSLIYQYFQWLPFFTVDVPLPRRSFFGDLADSFRFDNYALREHSGFKVKSLSLDLVHRLGDWNATLGVTMVPYLDLSAERYKHSYQVSFLVQWVPIAEIKTDMSYNQRANPRLKFN